jgi:GNAT superfamily N-acetyltransferase
MNATPFQVAVRLVSEADVPLVIALVRDVLSEFGLQFGEGSETDEQLAGLPSSYVDAGGAFWVALGKPAEIVGTCGLYPVAEGTFELRKMYLRSVARRRGVGQLLLDESIAWARSRGGTRMVLDTVEQMKGAIGFYEANGFARDDTQIRGARCTRGYARTI